MNLMKNTAVEIAITGEMWLEARRTIASFVHLPTHAIPAGSLRNEDQRAPSPRLCGSHKRCGVALEPVGAES